MVKGRVVVCGLWFVFVVVRSLDYLIPMYTPMGEDEADTCIYVII